VEIMQLGRTGLKVAGWPRMITASRSCWPRSSIARWALAVIPWSPLNRGVLGGILMSRSTGRRGHDEAREILAAHHDQIGQWEDFCAEFGPEPAEIAIAWLLHQPAVTAPIVGPGTLRHLETALRAVDLRLDGAALARLDEIWPGPGPAPESYAW